MTCPMCGHQFEPQQAQQACEACPLSSGCQIICCPNCGYRMPAEPPTLDTLRRWWRSLSGGRGAAPTGTKER